MSQGGSLQEQVSKKCHIMLCYVSDIVFVAYGYVAMINSLQSLGSAVLLLFFCVRNFGE